MLQRSTTASCCAGSTHAATQSAASSSAVSKVDAAHSVHASPERLRTRHRYAVFDASGSPAYSISDDSALSTTPVAQTTRSPAVTTSS